ncbi:transcription factor iws1 [Tothia fuscella]|uniref:Transcription factor iws1 n=1 Tax=Tothia fuscella TaxID=1048955 RepID=A0A9P4NM65_9PEZI|nr:transcription factor iws1 [Tothia fuscella]
MEDLPIPDDSTINQPLPSAGNDPDDPLAPSIEEENSTPNPPLVNPTEDVELTGQNEIDKDSPPSDDISDNESILSDVDEAQFDDFDPTAIAVDDRQQVAVDDSNVGLLGVHKRKRTEAEIEESRKKKKRRDRAKEKGRTKPSRKTRDGSEPFSGGEELDGKRSRKRKGEGGDGEKSGSRAKKVDDEVDESLLTPDERRRRALDQAMDAALKNPNSRRRKKDGIDLDAMADTEIDNMRTRMTLAAKSDADAREKGQPAMHKLKMLPDVVALLNRNTIATSLVDPDINLLEAVRFFLEPLSDGSLPAYNIQKEMFAALGRLPIGKEALIASGIGKVVLFYTRSARPEGSIKRQAERLLSDWMRPILRRSDDYRKREVQSMDYDPVNRLPIRPSQASQNPNQAARDRALATPVLTQRARVEGGLGTYTIAPKSNVNAGMMGRAPGRSGEEQFRKLKAKNATLRK